MIDHYKWHDQWPEVKAAARTTIGRDGEGVYPSDAWKKNILLAEHSPIRKMNLTWRWKNLKSWVSVHFTRHKIGIEHWVSTQRSDRTGTDRDSKRQDSPVTHECQANAQALINISRKRLCAQASPETRAAWVEVKDIVRAMDPVLASVMVPECIYRGFCPEMKCCGYAKTDAFLEDLAEYRKVGAEG